MAPGVILSRRLRHFLDRHGHDVVAPDAAVELVVAPRALERDDLLGRYGRRPDGPVLVRQQVSGPLAAGVRAPHPVARHHGRPPELKGKGSRRRATGILTAIPPGAMEFLRIR